MKRRSHSGSALLSSSRANQAQQHQQQQQMSLSSTGLNLMSGEGCSSALLAQLLQPSTLPSASGYHHVKPILPAPPQPPPQGAVVLPTTVLVASPLTLAPKPTVPTSSDLTPQQRPQPPVSNTSFILKNTHLIFFLFSTKLKKKKIQIL